MNLHSLSCIWRNTHYSLIYYTLQSSQYKLIDSAPMLYSRTKNMLKERMIWCFVCMNAVSEKFNPWTFNLMSNKVWYIKTTDTSKIYPYNYSTLIQWIWAQAWLKISNNKYGPVFCWRTHKDSHQMHVNYIPVLHPGECSPHRSASKLIPKFYSATKHTYNVDRCFILTYILY